MSASPPRAPAAPALAIGGPGAVVPPGGEDELEVWPDAAGRAFAVCHSRGGRHWLDLAGVSTFRFQDDGRGVAATPRPGVTSEAVEEAYRHSALPFVLQALGLEVLHASAVVARPGLLAFCGASGSGKSTVAYGLHGRGLDVWADDAVALRVGEAAITAAPLPFDVRLRPASAAHFGLGSQPARLALPGGAAERPIAAVCVIERGGPIGLAPLEPSRAFPAILAHAFCFTLRDLGRKRAMLAAYLSLVARVPAWRLGVGDGLGDLDATLDAIERDLAGAPGR